jgi:hypothetical protein
MSDDDGIDPREIVAVMATQGAVIVASLLQKVQDQERAGTAIQGMALLVGYLHVIADAEEGVKHVDMSLNDLAERGMEAIDHIVDHERFRRAMLN